MMPTPVSSPSSFVSSLASSLGRWLKPGSKLRVPETDPEGLGPQSALEHDDKEHGFLVPLFLRF